VKGILLTLLLTLVLVGGPIAVTEVRCVRSRPSCLGFLWDRRSAPTPTSRFSDRELRPLKGTPAGDLIGRMDAAQIRRLLTALNDE
jgi:hypothetical protein